MFVNLILFIPPLNGIQKEFDVDIEFDFKEVGLSEGALPKFVLYIDRALWKFFLLNKDLNLESLRWYLLLQEFEFEVHDKG